MTSPTVGPERRTWLADAFERQRPHLRRVAYRMLGSTSEAEDAVQEAWLRLDRADPGSTDDLRGWLTVVVGRICLDLLRSRRTRQEAYRDTWLPEPIVETVPDGAAEGAPEAAAVLADTVGLALLVVLESLAPAERLAFVLHDVFGVPFEEVARVVDRTPAAARQLASRARRRVRAASPAVDADLAIQRRAVDAFLKAARAGDFTALMEVLDPNVVLRADGGGRGPLARPPVHGAADVARSATFFGGRFGAFFRPALVNGAPGAILRAPGQPLIVAGFIVVGGRIVEIDLMADPAKLHGLRA